MSIEKITEILITTGECKRKDINPDAKLEDLGVDSLKAITILYDIEEAFNIEIPNDIISSIVTVKNIQEQVASLRQKNP